MITPTRHPCASLPVTGYSLSVWYCHHHQAWFGSTYVYRQDTETHLETAHHEVIDLGPFDTRADIIAWALGRVEAWPEPATALPWDDRASAP